MRGVGGGAAVLNEADVNECWSLTDPSASHERVPQRSIEHSVNEFVSMLLKHLSLADQFAFCELSFMTHLVHWDLLQNSWWWFVVRGQLGNFGPRPSGKDGICEVQGDTSCEGSTFVLQFCVTLRDVLRI